ASLAELLHLSPFEFWIVGMQRNGFFAVVGAESVHAHDDAIAFFDRALIGKCGLLNLTLNPSAFNRRQHSSESVDRRQTLKCLAFHLVGRRFKDQGTSDWIHGIRDTGLPADDLLRTKGKPRRFGCR